MKHRPGFTLIELLVVIAIIAILAAIILSALSRAKSKAHQITCLNHLKQLTYAWHYYIHDHEGRLPPNDGGGSAGSFPGSWVVGNAKTDPNTLKIEQGVLFP